MLAAGVMEDPRELGFVMGCTVSPHSGLVRKCVRAGFISPGLQEKRP